MISFMSKIIFNPKVVSLPLIIFVGLAFVGGIFLYHAWIFTLAQQDAMIILEMSYTPAKVERLQELKKKKARMAMQEIKGLYLTAYSAGNIKKVAQIVDLIKKTELNAIVIDTKDYTGKVLYDSDVPLVNELDLEDPRINRLKELITALHKYDIYVIARQTVFQDPILAKLKPEWAIKNTSGGIWKDYKGLAWVDPANKQVWDYNIEIAKEAIKFGFDEVNFDYVRFPSDGNMAAVAYNNGERKKYEVMGEFFHYLNINLTNTPIKISIDMFGFVMEKDGEDDMNIGQRLEDSLDEVDVISPMMYPSHYPPGHLGLVNPAQYPGKVIANGMEMGAHKFAGRRAVLRPWIQAFNIGAIYDAEKIRAQIDAVEKYTNGGWLLWNASNRYSDAGLRDAEEKNNIILEPFESLLEDMEDKL